MRTVRVSPRFRALVLALLTAYVVGLVIIVFGPWGWELNRVTVSLYKFFRHDVPIAPGWALPEHYGLLLNVVLFVPFGAGVRLLTGRPWWWVTLVAAAGSAVVEAAQGLWLPREAAWSDILANTGGGFLGAAVVSLLARARRQAGSRSGRVRRR